MCKLRMAQVLIDRRDLVGQEGAAVLTGEPCEDGILEQQRFEFEPGRARLDVGEIPLCELHAPHRHRQLGMENG